MPDRSSAGAGSRPADPAAPNIADLLRRFSWLPIPGCPGRFTLSPRRPELGIEELLGAPANVRRFEDTRARDAVIVVELEGGGVISYERADGTWLHTLNTPSGFRRKLRELGITGE